MNKKIFTILFPFLFIFTLILPISADSTEIYSTKIPDKMLPYSEITFIDSTHYVIDEGGLANDLTTSDTSDSKTPGIPGPVAGVTVTYASDGCLQDITFPDGVTNPLLHSQPLSSASSLITTRVIIPDGYSVVAQWGSHNNTLYENAVEKYRIGVGRGTTFSDVTSQGNLTNVKGSVATKLAYDNIDLNTTVRVSTINGSGVIYYKNMTKTDAGGMPDAIIDIWKTGVEYWGYTWNSSFSMPYTVTIGHTY
ncbi:hypothetical protein SDC9_136807 [bioreactor metagenome]|uniref:Uncharacterized protein n=1 Tax=bioreactor metagenome TaxID=1076179 RepID=A0A645DKA5_9ZZZZ